MNDTVISVKNVGKCFRAFNNKRSQLINTLWPKYKTGMQEIWALKGVSFEIRKGEAVAIIGRNGGGKSTLLEILTGTLTATTGEVKINGRVSALLELGSGFNPEYTGRDNVVLNGLLLGLTREEISERFNEVTEFADIGDAIDRPVKTYSSGMVMRLAFSVQIMLKPEILIVDEALGVGDFFFQQKCFARLRQMRNDGLTLLFVSHDMGTVRDICQRALYLRAGNPEYFGDTTTAIRMYMNESQSSPNILIKNTLYPLPQLFDQMKDNAIWSRYPNGDERLISVHICNTNGLVIDQATLGESVRIRACYRTTSNDESLIISLAIKNRYDQIVTSINSTRLGIESIIGKNGQHATFEFELDLMLEAGLYSFRISLGRLNGINRAESVDTTDWLNPFQINWDYENQSAPFFGMFGLPVRGELK
ncbi:MAG: ABC transporter ATP-binding protein [Gammaproteobacteria bacterium]|nr:ABC transporter ATP-binding protein [Gammaproteobacteria bacterium]